MSGPPGGDGEPLRLLTVHAHPDDESSKGAGTIARYRTQGVSSVLVCCTGGEEGDILNPSMDRPDVRERLHDVRLDELAAATEIIGYDAVELLGYRDSGMPDSEANANPACFARVPLDEAVGRLVEIIRRYRPHVVVTYSDDQQGYPHPDHLRVHEITLPAFELAGDASAHPDAGPPWTPSKLYYTTWSRKRMLAMHEAFLERGLESPFDASWFERPSQDERMTTTVDITGFGDVRRRALLAHATQVDPDSKFWFGLPPEVADELYPYDEYILAASRVPTDIPEDDLFAGLRAAATVDG